MALGRTPTGSVVRLTMGSMQDWAAPWASTPPATEPEAQLLPSFARAVAVATTLLMLLPGIVEHDKVPAAPMSFTNWPAVQATGSAAKDVAVVALPVKIDARSAEVTAVAVIEPEFALTMVQPVPQVMVAVVLLPLATASKVGLLPVLSVWHVI